MKLGSGVHRRGVWTLTIATVAASVAAVVGVAVVAKTAPSAAGAATPVAMPNISAPPDAIVGEADGSVTLNVTLDAPGTNTVTVKYATSVAGGCNNLTPGASGMLTFAPGVQSRPVTIAINNCGLSTPEGEGWFTLNLSAATNAVIVRPSTLIGVIGDPSPTGVTPGLYVRNAVVDTSAQNVSIPVLLGGPTGATSASTVTVQYTTVDGSAVAGTDYTLTKGMLTYKPGQTVQNITVPIIDRTGAAPTRSFSVTLSSPANAVITQGTGVVTIGASGGTLVSSPNISAPPDVIVGEADGYVDLPVTLSAPSANTVTVAYATNVGGGCNNLAQAVSGTLTFTPGVTTQVVRVIINNCGTTTTQGEGWDSFTLSKATVGVLVRPSTLIGVIGDPSPTGVTPGLYVRNAVVDTSAQNVSIPVLLGGPTGATSASTVTVHYTTTNGSAVAGTDYTATSGTLTYGPGQTVQNITVPIIDRTGAAPTRSFSVTLSSPANAVITQGTGVVTIGASGGTLVSSPNISAPPDVIVGEADGYVDLPVTLSAPSANTVTVAYATNVGGGCNNLAQAVSGTLTFTPGVTTQVVRVIINNCGTTTTQGEGWDSFTLSKATVGVLVRPSTLIGVIGDPSPTGVTPGLYVRNAVVDTSAQNVSIPVLLGGPTGATSASTVTVHYTTTNGSAVAGTDYTATSGTLTYGPGQTVQNITVPIIDRTGAAPTRSFSVTLSSPANAVITQGTGVVTIGASGGTLVSSPNISAPPDVIVGEADGYVDLPVTLSAPSANTVTVAYATNVGGGCNNLAQAVSGTLTFTPGVTTQVVRVIINNCGTTTGGADAFTLSGATVGVIVRPSTTVTIDPSPSVTKISPTSGPGAGGTTVTITGVNFTGVTKVLFGATAASSFTVVSSTSITAVSPAQSAGIQNISVTTTGGTSPAVVAAQFTYTSSGPTTSVLVPSAGATLSGTTTLDAAASNATSVTFVLFGGSFGLSGSVLCTATLTEFGWACSWNSTSVPNGGYVLESKATNGTGSVFSAGVSVTVANTAPPTTSVLVPAKGATLSGTTTLDAAASNATSVKFVLFGGSFGFSAPVLCTATLTEFGWACSWNSTSVPNASYVLESEATNAAGTTFSAGVSITVANTTPPTTSVLVPAKGATLSGTTTLDAAASNATSVKFVLFGGSFGFSAPVLCTATLTEFGWACSWNSTTVPNTSYILESEATNSAGTTFSAGVSITVKN